ncbi:MAG: DNA-methyltransferase [Solirubrobacteraceae bacterium]
MSKLAIYEDDTRKWGLIHGDALAVLAKLPERSVDVVLTDPPYGIALGAQEWDRFGSARTAPQAFERWSRTWAAQAARVLKPGGHLLAFGSPRTFHRLVSGIEDGGLEIRDTLMWLNGQGFPKSRRLTGGRAATLKPAFEPIVLARAPLEGSTTANLEKWGTGALNIDEAGIGAEGYWPANVAWSHSPDCPATLIDRQSTGPSRLFFCAKASRKEREAGCDALPRRSVALYTGERHSPRLVRNLHPTVKPASLMCWLVRLAAPPGGVVLDPFSGSGTTGIAAVLEGRTFLGIEREGQYVDIACARLTHHARQVAT